MSINFYWNSTFFHICVFLVPCRILPLLNKIYTKNYFVNIMPISILESPWLCLIIDCLLLIQYFIFSNFSKSVHVYECVHMYVRVCERKCGHFLFSFSFLNIYQINYKLIMIICCFEYIMSKNISGWPLDGFYYIKILGFVFLDSILLFTICFIFWH